MVLLIHGALDDETFNDDQIYKERLNEVKSVTIFCCCPTDTLAHKTCLQIELCSTALNTKQTNRRSTDCCDSDLCSLQVLDMKVCLTRKQEDIIMLL